MKNNIQEEYNKALSAIKAKGVSHVQEELEGLESTLKVTKNLSARMGLLGTIAMHETALQELEGVTETLAHRQLRQIIKRTENTLSKLDYVKSELKDILMYAADLHEKIETTNKN